jgi:hypothetical protein
LATAILQVVTFFGIALVTGSQKADASKFSFAAPIVAGFQKAAWWLLPLLAVLLFATEKTKKKLGKPSVWVAVKDCLDKLRDDIFAGEDEGLEHQHRVTLFKVCHRWEMEGWRPRWRRVLKPVQRSGYTTQETPTFFRVPDNAEQAEGIAGRTWAKGSVLIVSGLPDISETSPDDEIREYAERTWITEGWLRAWMQRNQRRPPLSFCGIPVEIDGTPWGVVVLDSRSISAVTLDQRNAYELGGWFLARLIKRA